MNSRCFQFPMTIQKSFENVNNNLVFMEAPWKNSLSDISDCDSGG